MSLKNISLYELGKEYEKHIELQTSFIERCKRDIKNAEKQGDRDAARELRSNLYKFYEIKRELEETSRRLKNYYEGENDGEKNN